MSGEESDNRTTNGESPPELLISDASGFLVLGLLTGFAIGYGEAERASRLRGHLHWYTNWSPEYFEYSMHCLVIGPLAGLLISIAFDVLVRDPLWRRKSLLYWFWILFIGVITSPILLPGMPMARE